MAHFNNEVWDQACTGMITDECDELKIRYTCLTGYNSNNTSPSFYGYVRTVELEEGDYKDENINLGLGFLNKLGSSDVLFVKGSKNFAYFGELMTRFSIKKNINGVVIEGATRDNNYTLSRPLPILYRSKTPVDIKGRGRVCAVDNILDFKGNSIRPGSFIFGDSDGVVIIDCADLDHLEKAVSATIEKENNIISAIDTGMPINDIIENFKSF